MRSSVIILVMTILGGCLAVTAVVLGAILGIPGFCPRTGYFGVHFLDSFLYSLGPNPVSIVIVACVWFVYGTILGGIAGSAIVAAVGAASREDGE